MGVVSGKTLGLSSGFEDGDHVIGTHELQAIADVVGQRLAGVWRAQNPRSDAEPGEDPVAIGCFLPGAHFDDDGFEGAGFLASGGVVGDVRQPKPPGGLVIGGKDFNQHVAGQRSDTHLMLSIKPTNIPLKFKAIAFHCYLFLCVLSST